MKIKSISVNHHAVLGSIKINLGADSEDLSQDLLEKYHADIHCEIDSQPGPNQFTYVIGENGIGKTILFRSLINFINWNTSVEADPKLKSIIKLYPKNQKYIRLSSMDPGDQELVSLSIYNKYFIAPGSNEIDFLKFFDAQLVFITSTSETSIIHKNNRYRSFNYLSEIGQTKLLFLKALIKYGKSDKVSHLNLLLGNKDIKWEVSGYLSYDAVGEVKMDSHVILLRNENGVNIINFLNTLKTIQIDRNRVDLDNSDPEFKIIFEAIYNSGAFFKLYYDFDGDIEDLFARLLNSTVINRIEEFLGELDTHSTAKDLNVRINDLQREKWTKLISGFVNLNLFEANVLALLQSLNLVKITIHGDGIPIDVMSSGQKNLIRLFSFFADMPIPDQLSNCIVLFDEPENSLHPKWQQDFPMNFKKIVEDVYGISNSHFIFATHSPLLLMKSALMANSNVLRFYKDQNLKFKSELIKNVNSYSVEEILLDEFKISYRDQGAEDAMRKILTTEYSKRATADDPVNSVKNSFELRDKINALFNEISKG